MTQVYVISILILFLGALLGLFFRRSPKGLGYFSFLLVLLSSLGIFYVVRQVFLLGPVVSTHTLFSPIRPQRLCLSCHATPETLFTVPGLGAVLTFRIDSLSSVFLTLISIVGICATLYSIRYMDHYKRPNLTGFYSPLLLFLGAMMALVGMADMFFFFIFWELMTLTSYFLVVFEREKRENLRAGFKYFLMTHIATACMFIGAILIYVHGKSFSFENLRETLGQLITSHPGLVHLILALFFVGFATKAGIFPFGDWLPDAHPAAPSGVSAILSGVMIKMGAYGLLRMFITILPSSYFTSFWGGLIATFGTISLFVGTLAALMQKDSKRLLAFHSIGQIGYIFLALGMGIAFLRINPAISAIALIAGLFHVMNHALFKGLLFLNAGSILYQTETRNLNEMGGLYKWMPFSAVATLVGALSISGLPPFNGFASKWLIYQTTILGGIDRPAYIFFGIFALFISAVTLASMLKFLSCAFFGKPSEGVVQKVRSEIPASMQIPQFAVAVLCLLLGLYPKVPILFLYEAIPSLGASLAFPRMESLFGASAFVVSTNLGEGIGGIYNGSAMVIAFLILMFVAFLLYRMGGAKVREDSTWYCGERHVAKEVHYRAYSFYLPFEKLMRIRIGGYQQEGIYPTFRLPRISLSPRLKNLFDVDEYFYYPITRWFMRLIDKFSHIHVGIPQVYVLWMIIGMVLAIIILFSLSGA
ncbi:MAG: proton-conducting transporter membrane subunit [candidate division NC10 bacterium]|nr:proton-conducting transporter membrane subunit [candidate division NC10 bacterium]